MANQATMTKHDKYWYEIVPPHEGWDRISRAFCGRDHRLHPVALAFGINSLTIPGYALGSEGEMLGWSRHALDRLERRCHQFDFELEALSQLSNFFWRCEQRWGVDFVAFGRGAVFSDLMKEDLVMAQRLYDLNDTREAAL